MLRPRRRWSWSYVWLLPVLAALCAAWLVVDAWQQRGPGITLHFLQGHGLKPGDALRYRGIQAGQVVSVRLADDLGSILVAVQLAPGAADLARGGSRFWIVRPQLDLSGVSGLETVVGANYLSVLPGRGEPRREFIGLEEPPLGEAMAPGGLRIVLSAPGKGNLRPGAPVSYRQVVIGTVVSVELAKDASAVEADVYIKPDYANLIRDNIKFWRVSGARVSAGLGGFSVAVDSVHSLVMGGINLAIPPQPGKRAVAGAGFPLYDQPEDQWLEWAPGLSLSDEITQRPHLVPATVRWQDRNWLYLKRSNERHAWLLPWPGGLLGPADVLLAPNDARLYLDGQPFDPEQPVVTGAPGLALLPLEHDYPLWPQAHLRGMDKTKSEDTLLIAGPELPTRYIGAVRWRRSDDDRRWQTAPTPPFDPQWHGAAVVAESDGALLGILLVDDGAATLVSLTDGSLTDRIAAPDGD